MDLDDLNKMWSIDCVIDELDLSKELRNIPVLHNKYFSIYSKFSLKMKKLKSELIELEKAKMEYYSGSMDEIELKQRGWKPNPLKILRTDLNKYIESDKEIIELSLKIGYLLQIIEYLENIIKQINNRGYYISDIIKWEKFRSGVNY